MVRFGVPAVVLLGLITGGCATAMRGTTQRVRVESDPASATVTLDEKTYTTPFEVTLKRNARHTVLVSAPGYQPVQFMLEGKLDAAGMGNIVLPGGTVLLAGDVASGGAKNYNRLAKIHLQKIDSPTTQPITMYEWQGRLLTESQLNAAKQRQEEDQRQEMQEQKISR
jgi:hypothetical protein